MATRYQHLLPALNRLARSAAPVGLATVGQDANLSPGRAQRVFQDIVGESPKQFQLRVRLQRAAAQLAGSEARVIDIALASGFESHEAFTRAFGRRFGMSPRDYRRSVPRWPDIESIRLASRAAPCIGIYGRRLGQHSSVFQEGSTMEQSGKSANKPVTNPASSTVRSTVSSTASSPSDYTVERRELEAVPVLYGRRRTDRDTVADAMAEVLPAAFGYAMAQGLAMAGPPYVRYVEQSPAFFTIEGGVPLTAAAETPAAETGISVGELPAGPVAATVHRGPYESLGNAHRALDRWMAENDVTAAGPPWEVYLTDPTEVPDPADWLTEVIWPIN